MSLRYHVRNIHHYYAMQDITQQISLFDISLIN